MVTPPRKPPGFAQAGIPPRPLAPRPAQAGGADAEEPEQLVSSELDELTHAEYRLLYDEAARNVLFAKRQQWRVVEYFTLLALALVALGAALPFAADVARFVAVFLVIVGAVSVAVLAMLQIWQGREQAMMAYLVGDLSNFARHALRYKPRLSGNIHRFIILAAMMLYVVILDVVVFRLLADIGK
ncbi:MAG TPA: hypothetical protein VF194_13500 [Ferrovibrio sp.]|uniref:hypothetical protein n=1 Tax=Ferrovibrio sp. TaxID=1917215 RepID=UPI002ED43FB5